MPSSVWHQLCLAPQIWPLLELSMEAGTLGLQRGDIVGQGISRVIQFDKEEEVAEMRRRQVEGKEQGWVFGAPKWSESDLFSQSSWFEQGMAWSMAAAPGAERSRR